MVDTHRNSNQVMLRLPDGMKERLQDSAQSNRRSVNAEIVARLEGSFTTGRSIHADLASAIERHIEAEVQERIRMVASRLAGGVS